MSTEIIQTTDANDNNDANSAIKVTSEIVEQSKIIEITPKRQTTSLELDPYEQVDQVEKARKQLENLSKKPRKKSTPATSDNENSFVNLNKDTDILQMNDSNEIIENSPVSEVLYSKPTMSNLSSAIISKEELENEIRRKIAKPDSQLPTLKKVQVGEIEIPKELILSELSVASTSNENEHVTATTQELDGQELIDILEGKPDDEGEMFEVIGENGMFIVKDKKSDQVQTTSYEIIATEDEKMSATKQKLLEREIAMRQIASMPTRKNRKLKQTSPATSSGQKPTLAQSLAMDWNDEKEEEVILELENIEEGNGEPKIKILNMTILNEEDVKSRIPPKVEPPKILNKNAPKNNAPPKILNINAPSQTVTNEETPRRGRVIKKKTIWDPSEATVTAAPTTTTTSASLPQNKLPIALPSTITIKKLTKESLTKPTVESSSAKKGKKKSEIDKLFQDEGAVNMIYSLERQNNNQDVPEIKVNVDQKSFVDKSEEKSTLLAKTKTIKQTIIKQSVSPPETKVTTSTRPQRVKRDLTPNKSEETLQEKTEKTVIITKAQKTTPAVGRKKKVDDSWDFVRKAQTTCDDAMIIRRHSNSSYSSSATSPRRLSLDQLIADTEGDDSFKIKDESNGFKFMKPQEKKTPELQKDLKTCVGGLVEELRNTLSSKLSKGKIQAEKTAKGKKRTAAAAAVTANQESPPSKRSSDRRSYGNEKEYQVVKFDGVAQITLNPNPLTINLLSEIKTILNSLEVDDNCKVVLVTANESFSKGLDYSTLSQTTVDKRKQAASDLVTAVKNFFISLAAFPKILVCGLKGSVSGIGVTMLPLFDIVIADSSTKFSLPHARIGSNPEGISLLKLSNKISENAITELFYMNDTLNASSALNYGLVSKIVPNNNVDEQAKEICKRIATFSSQALESTKNILNEEFLSSIDQQLSREMKILQQQWITMECQENFKRREW